MHPLQTLEAEAIQRLLDRDRAQAEDRDRADLVALREQQGDRQRHRELDLARLVRAPPPPPPLTTTMRGVGVERAAPSHAGGGARARRDGGRSGGRHCQRRGCC
jgi:cell division septation protein DedD